MSELNGATVLITGAGGGFGRELTKQIIAAGGEVILTDREEGAASLESEFADNKSVLAIIRADLAASAGCDAIYKEVTELARMPDIVINNAGIAFFGRPDLVPEGGDERLMQINLLSPMRLCRLFLPHLISKGSGHIVNISSVAGWLGATGLSAYSASKFGLRGYGESLAADVAEHGIQVSTVFPWFSRTPILDSEQYGADDRREIPDEMVTDPADVVGEMIKGIRANRELIFPDRMARRMQWIKRFVPWLVPILNKRLEARTA